MDAMDEVLGETLADGHIDADLEALARSDRVPVAQGDGSDVIHAETERDALKAAVAVTDGTSEGGIVTTADALGERLADGHMDAEREELACSDNEPVAHGDGSDVTHAEADPDMLEAEEAVTDGTSEASVDTTADALGATLAEGHMDADLEELACGDNEPVVHCDNVSVMHAEAVRDALEEGLADAQGDTERVRLEVAHNDSPIEAV